MKSQFFTLFFFSVFFFIGCEQSDQKRFELLDSEYTGVDFVNELTLSDSFNILEFDYIYNGAGVAIGDFNNDNLPDLFFTGNQVSCRLYLNKGNMKFEDITVSAGVATSQWTEGVTLVDINNDGLLDIYISTSSGGQQLPNSNLLFVNQGISEDGTPNFSEEASEYGIADTGYNTQATFFDYDLDGDLDLYLLANALENFNRNTTRPKKLDGTGNSTDKLYQNNGDDTFTDVSKEAGILVEGYGLGIAVTDINKDGWPDIYIANDFVTNDILYVNNGDGTFSNRIADQIKHQSHNGMGADAADYNNDGFTDILVLDMMPEDNLRQKAMMFPFASYDRYMLNLSMDYEPQYVRNTLQLNNGNGSFSEIGQLAGVHKTDWSWAPLFADLDNDGWKDLFITNGYGKDITDMDYVSYSQSLRSFGTEAAKRKALLEEISNLIEIRIPNYAFKNQGDLTFADRTDQWGLTHASLSNGAAFADLDNDGDLDMVVNNVNDPAFIYQNRTIETADSTSNYLKIVLEGSQMNRQGLGSKIYLYYQKDGKSIQQYHEHYLTRGYKSTVDHTIHFGLGKVTKTDSLRVTWPDGKQQSISGLTANQVVTLKYREADSYEKTSQSIQSPLFQEVSDSLNLKYTHQAEDFADFKIQPLLPHKHSENSPGIAVGDVNGDQLDDFYVGGSPGYPGKLFIQSEAGTFTAHQLAKEQTADDMGALFFDSDNDGDLDLYVVSGGSRFPKDASAYQDRLYINDGAGNFRMDTTALPVFKTSGSVATAADFDQDGDLDIFVGGRVIPHEYPLPPKSYLLENQGGKFVDITHQTCPELASIGMVTSALWTDINKDNHLELIITGEWMPVTIFEQAGDDQAVRFKNITKQAGLAKTSGWWNSMQAGDFDNDGDVDFIAGNLGLNSRYKTSEKEPVSVYAKDFDKNGEIDPIMFYYNQGENYPAHTRNELISQIAALRGRFPKYESLGKTTFEDFFKAGELDSSYTLRSYEMRTSWIENKGDGTFTIHPLPLETQFSPTCGILPDDLDEDGNLDLLLVGNAYGTELYTGRYDASYGNVLLGDGNGNFLPQPTRETGFFVDGNSKSLTKLTDHQGKSLYLVTQNQGNLLAFSKATTGAGTIIKPGPLEQRAVIEMHNGEKYHQEFYYGSSYLSQATRTINISGKMKLVTFYNYNGEERKVDFSEK